MTARLSAALLSALLLALSFPLTLPALPSWVLGVLPFNLPADPALGSFTIPGLATQLGYIQFPALAFVALVPLLYAVRAARKPGEAFWLGLSCGFLWLLLTFLWLISFGLVPVLLLAFYFALPLGLFTWLIWNLMHLPAKPHVEVMRLLWAVPLIWTALEYVRSFGLWAFPWNLLGYTQAASPLLAQTADIGGVYMVSFLIVLVNALIVTLLSSAGTLSLRFTHGVAAVLVLALAAAYGWWRIGHVAAGSGKPLTVVAIQGGLSSRDEWGETTYQQSLDTYTSATRNVLNAPTQTGRNSALRLVPQMQGRIGSPAQVGPTQIGGMSTLQPVQPTRPTVPTPPVSADTLAIWPEGSLLKVIDTDLGFPGVPYQVRQLVEDNPSQAILWGALAIPPRPVAAQPVAPAPQLGIPVSANLPHINGAPQSRTASILHSLNPRESARRRAFGTPPRQITPTLTPAQQQADMQKRLSNGCFLTTREADAWQYAKVRLVPYGEVEPFRGMISFFHFPWQFGHDLNGGREIKVVKWKGHTVGPLICFDNVFAFIPRAEARAGAGFLVLMTNNSWYPMRSGIRQHADIDVLRAIETRRPLVRCSTTGWSQVVAPSGYITQSTEQRVGRPETLQATLQPGSEITPYVAVGDLFAQLCLLAALLFAVPPLVVGRSEGFL